MVKDSGMRYLGLVCMGLIVIILAVYLQTGNHQFLNLDDDVYVTSNPHVASGITVNNIIWAFTSVESSHWHPVTWLSHMADAQLYGMNPRGHHLTSVVIHTISTLLLLLLLFRITGSLWQSSFVAALFALHPLRVESVAWVAERKDVLSAFFWLLTLLFYSEYVVKRKPALYILTLFSFMLGLMSKPMLVSLPIVMLLMDYWPLDRYRYEGKAEGLRQRSRRVLALIREKIPFFACSLLSSVVTSYAMHKAGIISGLEDLSFQLRIENALVAYVRYIGKTVWPHDLAVYYPFNFSIPLWQVIGSLLVLILMSAAAIRAGRRYPYLAVGWFWFLVTLIPVIGLMQVGNQSMADRYSYIPGIGLYIMTAWGVSDLTKGLQYREGMLALLGGAVLIASTALTWHQLGYWRDNISLFRHTLKVTTGNYIINCNLGAALVNKGDLDGAIRVFQEALRINPDYADAHNNLGVALASKGDPDAAIREYQVVLRLNPNEAKVHNNLGRALADKGEMDAAVREFREELRINPDDAEAHNNLGAALASKGDMDAAIREYQVVLRLNPNDAKAHNNLGLALAGKGDMDAAIREFQEALRVSADYTDAHNNLGIALAGRGALDAAIREFQEAVRINTNNAQAHYNLGLALASKGDLDKAIQELQEALRIKPDNAKVRDNLGRALAQKRMQDEARK